MLIVVIVRNWKNSEEKIINIAKPPYLDCGETFNQKKILKKLQIKNRIYFILNKKLSWEKIWLKDLLFL